MSYLYQNIVDDYRKRWDAMTVAASTKALADQVAKRLHSHIERYQAVSKATGVPPAVLMCIHEREASGNFSTYLGNGDPLNRVTVHVPKGRGPFLTWEEGAIDALKIDHLNAVNGWTIERAAYEFELYNGWGYRNHHTPSAYLWAGSNQYVSGKYVADRVWDAHAVDKQLGAMVLLKSIFDLNPLLVLPRDRGGLGPVNPPPPDIVASKPPPDIATPEPKKGQSGTPTTTVPKSSLPHGPIILGGTAVGAIAGGVSHNFWWFLGALVVVAGVAYLVTHLKRKGN